MCCPHPAGAQTASGVSRPGLRRASLSTPLAGLPNKTPLGFVFCFLLQKLREEGCVPVIRVASPCKKRRGCSSAMHSGRGRARGYAPFSVHKRPSRSSSARSARRLPAVSKRSWFSGLTAKRALDGSACHMLGTCLVLGGTRPVSRWVSLSPLLPRALCRTIADFAVTKSTKNCQF
jgi:hypothetical protein